LDGVANPPCSPLSDSISCATSVWQAKQRSPMRSPDQTAGWHAAQRVSSSACEATPPIAASPCGPPRSPGLKIPLPLAAAAPRIASAARTAAIKAEPGRQPRGRFSRSIPVSSGVAVQRRPIWTSATRMDHPQRIWTVCRSRSRRDQRSATSDAQFAQRRRAPRVARRRAGHWRPIGWAPGDFLARDQPLPSSPSPITRRR
jgi:hypothetical protein